MRYVYCIECYDNKGIYSRARRTGKKIKECRKNGNGSWLYYREYECQNCGLIFGYSESEKFWGPPIKNGQ